MIPEDVFRNKIADLVDCLPQRDGSVLEANRRDRTYYRHLGGLNDVDFVEACDRILFLDEWFPTIARIRAVVAECAADRTRREAAQSNQRAMPSLVCPYCHGARWVRLNGYDPLNMHAGEDGSRVRPCPRCTTGGRFDPDREAWLINDEGGVPNPEPPREVDMSRVTWPAQLASLRDPETGRLDMDALYRLSRELRGLDPNIDERPAPVRGFTTIGRAMPEPISFD